MSKRATREDIRRAYRAQRNWIIKVALAFIAVMVTCIWVLV